MIDRFMSKVTVLPDGCWKWIGQIVQGYGVFRSGDHQYKAHRVSYTLFKGEIPKGMIIMHKCDNRRCVNPEHLVCGTQRENLHDMASKGRKVVAGPKKGYKQTPLTDAMVEEIRASTLTVAQISEKYHVGKPRVRRILKNPHHDMKEVVLNPPLPPRRKLTDAMVEEIRASSSPLRILSERYGVTRACISNIRNKKARIN